MRIEAADTDLREEVTNGVLKEAHRHTPKGEDEKTGKKSFSFLDVGFHLYHRKLNREEDRFRSRDRHERGRYERGNYIC